MGDFNIDISKSCNFRKINTIAKHSNLNQLIKDYTRVTDKTKTIIDLHGFASQASIILASNDDSRRGQECRTQSRSYEVITITTTTATSNMAAI